MSSFNEIFSRPPVDDQPEIEERPEWSGPPDGEIGVAVPLSLVVARSESAAVALRSATAYTTGAILYFYAVVRGITSREMTMLFHSQHLSEHDADPPDEFLRLGIEIADGERVSNLGNPRLHSWKPGVTPEGPILAPQGGSSGGSRPGRVTLDQAYWLWPLPPPGLLRVFAEWPRYDVGLSGAELDTRALLEAGERSRALWDD